MKGSVYLILFFLVFAVSCNNSQQTEQDYRVFRYNEHTGIASLDPAFARNNATVWAANQLFNGLIQLDDSLNIQPDIAKTWNYNDSTYTYTFILRNDVYFHRSKVFGKDSTRLVTAYDFEYSFKRLQDPGLASPGSWVLQPVERFYAENDTLFAIQLK